MPGRTVLVAGAGFSKPHGGPLMRELLDQKRIEASEADPEALQTLSHLIEQDTTTENGANLEDVFTDVRIRAHTGGDVRGKDRTWPAEDLLDEIKLHLSSISDQVRLDMRTNVANAYVDYFEDLFDEARTLDVVTFNYDTLVEQCLEEAGIPYKYGNVLNLRWKDRRRGRGRRRADDRVDILKLHGSANWGFCRGCPATDKTDDTVTAFNTPYVPNHRRERCPRCEESMLDVGIIPPVFGKAGEVRTINGVWKRARSRVSRGTQFVVAGYSLPESDNEAVSLMRDVFGHRERPRVTVVCGESGAPESYDEVFRDYDDASAYFQDYIIRSDTPKSQYH